MPSLKGSLFSSDKVTREDLDRAWYGSVLSNMALFKRAGGKTDDLSRTDTPAHLFFKIFFYFDNPGEDGNRFSSNFLSKDFNPQTTGYTSLPWKNSRSSEDNVQYSGQATNLSESLNTHSGSSANTAMNYLLLNNEIERAEKLDKFIDLLSNISTYSPWYFQEITGLDVALERKEFTDKDFKIEEQRKQITINCLTDAYDNRIGTLLDLYRDITFSYQLHKEIVPANLRKFDMGIYIFNTPIKNFHGKDANFARFDNRTGNEYITSYKYIELLNCEIDYNSSKAAYATLDNKDGTAMNYPIIISFDSAMEKRYNEILMREIGDFVKWDIDCAMDPEYQKDENSRYEEFNKRLGELKNRGIQEKESLNVPTSEFNHIDGIVNHLGLGKTGSGNSKGIVRSATEQAIGAATSQAENFITHIALGNLHTGNIAGLSANMQRIQSGNILGGVQGILQQTGNTSNLSTLIGKSLHDPMSIPKTSRAMTWTKRKFEGYP
jgi:hypothetical protein